MDLSACLGMTLPMARDPDLEGDRVWSDQGQASPVPIPPGPPVLPHPLLCRLRPIIAQGVLKLGH